MDELNDLEKWVLETVKDIDKNLCEYAKEEPRTGRDSRFLDVQLCRMDLVNIIMGNPTDIKYSPADL